MAGRVLVAPCSHAQWGAHGYHPTWPELPRTSARVVGGADLVVSLDTVLAMTGPGNKP